ncbi:MAG TPA: type II toxin-antitoxin system VapC family toxin [Mycobacterium sp.]|nr:type II toxin-antitoxin system VapC family toxin [Mycobacterium sp.]HQC77489.1 type II toxin-antitoxin system VapC family toxin [Mycobacterium sp.]
MISAGLLDTSVFIAAEGGRQLNESLIPDQVVTSVITLAELNAGVLAAHPTEIRARRLVTLNAVADLEALPVDEGAAQVWARLRVHLAEAGRRIRANDLWIAAIAISNGLPVVTQDGDFTALEGAAGFSVIQV